VYNMIIEQTLHVHSSMDTKATTWGFYQGCMAQFEEGGTFHIVSSANGGPV
jgi:hypothetical protein